MMCLTFCLVLIGLVTTKLFKLERPKPLSSHKKTQKRRPCTHHKRRSSSTPRVLHVTYLRSITSHRSLPVTYLPPGRATVTYEEGRYSRCETRIFGTVHTTPKRPGVWPPPVQITQTKNGRVVDESQVASRKHPIDLSSGEYVQQTLKYAQNTCRSTKLQHREILRCTHKTPRNYRKTPGRAGGQRDISPVSSRFIGVDRRIHVQRSDHACAQQS